MFSNSLLPSAWGSAAKFLGLSSPKSEKSAVRPSKDRRALLLETRLMPDHLILRTRKCSYHPQEEILHGSTNLFPVYCRSCKPAPFTPMSYLITSWTLRAHGQIRKVDSRSYERKALLLGKQRLSQWPRFSALTELAALNSVKPQVYTENNLRLERVTALPQHLHELTSN